jgi:protein gp37
MGVTVISWTGTPRADGSVLPGFTHNPWWGCAKVSPGCDRCYAEAFDRRTGGAHWGAGTTPRIMSEHNWNNPLRWHRAALKAGERRRVFCGSMCDWTDKNAPPGQRERLWQVIRATPSLDWLLLTKRAPNIVRCLPVDWDPPHRDANVWLGVTVENRKHGLPRIEHLRRVPARIRFLSIEPLLEDLGAIDLSGIHWVIVGGESGPRARPMALDWMISIRAQCTAAGIPFFYKQRGSSRPGDKGDCLINGIEVKEWPTAA